MNSNENTIFGIVITVIIVGMSVIIVLTMSSQPVTAVHGCGFDTFYHKETNSCELFPPLNRNQIKLSESLVSLLNNTKDNLNDDDVKYDSRGYALGKCPVMHGSNWDLDSTCVITLRR